MDTENETTICPDVITDEATNTSYTVSQFLGEGSFAKCFMLKQEGRKTFDAVKIVKDSILRSKKTYCFISEEVAIHSLLRHKNVVKFKSAFVDNSNLYIILELCSNGCLMDMMKRRGQLTIVEAKYLLKQILLGLQYLHTKDVVHGDLKPNNIFLNNRMVVKIGDFGLSTLMSYEEDLVADVCGTPNFMAPEIISKKGHSFAGDVWAIGCIFYGMTAGKLPFATEKRNRLRLEENIRNCSFSIYQPGLRKPVSTFIVKILRKNPEERPTAKDLLEDEFLSKSFIPLALPVSCLWEAPMPQDLVGKTSSSLTSSVSSKRKLRSSTKKKSKITMKYPKPCAQHVKNTKSRSIFREKTSRLRVVVS